MNSTVGIALFGWPAVALVLCALLPKRRAVISAYVAAWLFLPVYQYPISGMPDWTKTSATSVSLLLGLIIFDFQRIAAFRPRWIDLPMLVWLATPIPSSLTNGLGLYDGLSISLDQVVTWGIPYFLGRLYFGDLEGLRELALGLFIGGVVYIPFCLYEIRMSPQLHNALYGFHPHSFAQTHRFGGWRPTVFMDHGLMVAMWMSMSSLAGVWLWVSGSLRSIRGVSALWFLVPLVLTSFLCKSAGAVVLLLAGLLLLFWIHRSHSRAPIYALSLVAPLYILVRLTGLWSGAELVEAATVFSEDRAASLETRLNQENLLSAKAMKQPIFGWGRSKSRWRVMDESGRDISITDGLWIIEFGQRGLFGLIPMLFVFLLPVAALIRRVSVRDWTRAWAAPAACLTAVVVLYLIDCIPNAHITPIYVLAAGGITGLLASRGMLREPVVEEETPAVSGS